MPRSVVLIACLLAIAAALSTWFWWPRTVNVPSYREADNQASTSTDPISSNPVVGGASRAPVKSNAGVPAASTTRTLKVQLHGLHRDAPWATELQIELNDRGRKRVFDDFQSSAPVQKDGRCDLPLPEWWQPGIRVKLRIHGRNAGYRELTHRNQGNLPFVDVLVLDAQPVAELSGKVIDSRGEPIANARVSAFAMYVGHPSGKAVGSASSNENGDYLLRTAPDIPLLIIATAMNPIVMRWRGTDGITDNGQLRGDVLPANKTVQLAINYPGTECNFTLADAAKVTGIIQWPDLEPIQGARVRFASREGTKLELSPSAEIRWQTNGTIVANGTTNVGRSGRFTIPASPGALLDLRVVDANEILIVGELMLYSVVAPIEQIITVPYPVTLRAIHQGQLVPHARILMHGLPPQRTRADGTLRAVVATNAMVRAEQGALRSPWQSVSSSQLRQTIDCDMASELAALHVEFEGEFPVRNAAFHWKCDDGRELTERLHRGDNSGPFEIWLEPGNYELQVGPTSGERNGTFLLPITRKFHIRKTNATGPALQLDLHAKLGGKFTLQVLDDNSQHLAGNILVRSARGKEHIVQMTGDGEPGSFRDEMTTCQGNLPPGPYEIVIDLGAKGVHRRYVTIKQRETSSVALRL
jgi:hypothetical protein